MPQLKQPSSLESIVLQSIQNIVLDLGHQLLEKVCSGTPATVLPIRWGVPSTIQQKVRKKAFDCPDVTKLQSFLHSDLPLHLSDAVTYVVLKAISTLIHSAKCTNDGFTKSGDDNCRDIIESLISSSLHERISHLDLLEWPWFLGEVLLKHLYKFNRLQALRLWPGNWSPVWTTIVSMLENNCCEMNYLISFSMRCHCTDKILQVLSNCTRLQYLDVMSSVEVTDECVSSLLKLSHLKIINMSSTSLTSDGYTRLLVGLPQLSKLVWYDLSGQALANISTYLLGLSSYEANHVTNDQLNLLVHICPYLTQVSFHWINADLSVLEPLACLREIKLANCNAHICNLRGLLEVRGSNILSLELHEVTGVDLLSIGILCRNLKKMNLRCDFVSSTDYCVSMNIFLFKHLEELSFGSEYCECLFFNCINIKKLEVTKCLDFNDQIVLTLLTKNPLNKLEELSVVSCGMLSFGTVLLLLSTCENLRVLEGLESWRGVTKSQVADLCLDMKKKNMHIEILWKKKLQINW